MSASLKAQIKSKIPLVVRLSKVFADPLRMKILAECNMREMSPTLFYKEFGGSSLSRVAHAFDVLVEYGWLYLTKKRSGGRRRGGVEHFYRATEPAVFDEALWRELPKGAKEHTTWRVLKTFVQQVKEAMEAGTMDARDDHHLTWTPLRLDLEGWKKVVAKLLEIFHFLFEEQERANLRMAKTGEEPIPMTVALAAFESPRETEKQY